MIIYLYGPDSYRRQKKVNFYLSEFKKKHLESISIDRFNLNENGDFERLKNFIKDQSLFGQGLKFGIVQECDAIEVKEIKLALKPVLQDKTTTLIISEEKKLKKALDTFLSKSFKSESFESLLGADFINFIRGEAQNRRMKLSSNEERQLKDSFEGDSWAVVNQLEKMALGEQSETRLKVPEMFPLMFALTGQATLDRKLTALAWLLEKEEPAKVFNIIASQRNMAVKKKMADYDVMVKSGKLEYEEVLTDLAIS
jgi:hypothetical protein